MSSPAMQAQVVIDFLKTSYRFDTFSEPRGVMRILQVIFAAWAFMACRDFTVTASASCGTNEGNIVEVVYPFGFDSQLCPPPEKDDYNLQGKVHMDPSLGAQIFVIISALAFLYALFIIVVYMYLDEVYKSKPEFPMADFSLTGIMCFFWIVGTLSLNSNANALQAILDIERTLKYTCRSDCVFQVTSFTDMNLTLLMGLLNIFLWAADLWFLYKETIWFQNRGAIYNQGMPGMQPEMQDNQFNQPDQFQQQQQFQQQDLQQPQQQYYGYDQSQQQQQPQMGGYSQQY